MEEDVALGGVGVAARDQLADQPDHVLGHVVPADELGRARLEGRRQAAERRHVLVELLARSASVTLADRLVQRQVGIFLRARAR